MGMGALKYPWLREFLSTQARGPIDKPCYITYMRYMTPQFGPAMVKLEAQEQLLVLCFFENGGNQSKALIQAGYEFKNNETERRMANYYFHKKTIQEAVLEESKRRTTLMVPKVQQALERLVESPEHQDHFKALKMVRDDAGISRAIERVLNVKVEVTQTEKIETIKRFALDHGFDPQKFLGFSPEKVEDAEFSEISSADDAENEDRELGII